MNNKTQKQPSTFNPVSILQFLYKNKLTVHLTLESNLVTWNLYYIDGVLQYANHSLQSLDTLEYYLSAINPGVATKIINVLKTRQNINTLQLIQIIHLLSQKQFINDEDKSHLLKKLTEDALESFLWLNKGEYHWEKLNKTEVLNIKNVVGDNPINISTTVKSLRIRHQLWQKLSPVANSPYQCPVFTSINDAQKKVPQGKLSMRVLTQLSKLVKGDTTIRDIATALKQDELKIIGLLAPYIHHGIVNVQKAKYPYDNLPTVSPMAQTMDNPTTPSSSPQQANIMAQSMGINGNHHLSNSLHGSSTQNKSKIICIDDSPTMLATIKDYLQGDYFEVVTVENPMESLSYLFESKPDLILMDLSMPKINGNRLSQILKSSSMFKNVPIIIVSGNHKMLDAQKIESIGARDFLAKPFSQTQLLNIVNKHLQNSYSAVNK
ncbi:response regulator [Cyanobacterium stanieri LEGE 03274]|uniref:Protein PatA n=1 Tax=Cyanobacterium stanieri LEGE 03274 TaxID=1828756 RepID=A0ABR9V0L9_9CHRO|nr:response regulator [Cyanobacterium stanieri]MBE9221429.1 response regulator [Cyanobacterium stanieri LEGE 03274]